VLLFRAFLQPPIGHVTPNREPPRAFASAHVRAASHASSHGRLSTPINIQTPTDQTK